MRLRLNNVVLYLGRPRKDGYRNVERIRFTDWQRLMPALRHSKYRTRLDGKRLLILAEDPNQLTFTFVSAS